MGRKDECYELPILYYKYKPACITTFMYIQNQTKFWGTKEKGRYSKEW
jgi:hypothetical protein